MLETFATGRHRIVVPVTAAGRAIRSCFPPTTARDPHPTRAGTPRAAAGTLLTTFCCPLRRPPCCPTSTIGDYQRSGAETGRRPLQRQAQHFDPLRVVGADADRRQQLQVVVAWKSWSSLPRDRAHPAVDSVSVTPLRYQQQRARPLPPRGSSILRRRDGPDPLDDVPARPTGRRRYRPRCGHAVARRGHAVVFSSAGTPAKHALPPGETSRCVAHRFRSARRCRRASRA
jgi:hypothetical protein